MHHRRWEPQLTGPSTNGATSFIKWLDSGPLTLLSNPGDATHNLGHTLDLAFATPDLLIWGASAMIEKSLHSTSDHCTLTVTIPLREKQRVHGAGKLMTGLIEEPAFRERLRSYPIPPCTSLATKEELDEEAITITEAISKTAASLAPRKRDSARGSPWWTEEGPKGPVEKEIKRKRPKSESGEMRGKSTKRGLKRKEEKRGAVEWKKRLRSCDPPPCPHEASCASLEFGGGEGQISFERLRRCSSPRSVTLDPDKSRDSRFLRPARWTRPSSSMPQSVKSRRFSFFKPPKCFMPFPVTPEN